jgi:predicted deacetylase
MTSIAATQFLPVVAAASAVKDFFVVSVHDVAPATQSIADEIIAELAACGVRTCSLLIVPDYHHRGASMKDRQFVSWLRGLEAQGYEMVIHGYFHQRPRRGRETLRERMITQVYTQDEGEFYDLRYDEAFRRIKLARDEFRAAGLNPRGFVAPAWLLSAEGEEAARDAEMEYTTRLQSVRDFRTGKSFRARSLVYSVRTAWRRTSSLIWNGTLARFVQPLPLVRVSIHPPDYSHPGIWRQIVRITSKMARSRTAMTYQDWVAEQRMRT